MLIDQIGMLNRTVDFFTKDSTSWDETEKRQCDLLNIICYIK